MASLRRLLVLVLLGTARAAAGDACNEDGSSAAYTETISTAQGVTYYAQASRPAESSAAPAPSAVPAPSRTLQFEPGLYRNHPALGPEYAEPIPTYEECERQYWEDRREAELRFIAWRRWRH